VVFQQANELSAATGQRILLGVTGGIAAYKAAELLRLLRKGGAEVRVVMTRAAAGFVAPLTFQALSGHPVRVEVLDPDEESAMSHIRLARWAELVLVAPASADFMARLRAGMADDLLTTLCLATTAPVWLAPAMNQAMWEHSATRENTEALRQRGVSLIGPAEGDQACGETGPGRLLEPVQIVERVFGFSQDRTLAGLRVLISAGPTREAIDPVRYLTNRSSGKMGYALAQAARAMGAEVGLVSGPTSLAVPDVSEVVRVESARDMHAAVLQRAPTADIYIGAAAVADYAPIAAQEKLKKDAGEMQLRLIRNPDILADVARLEQRPFCVGFAAETHDLEHSARSKLAAKNIDMVAANRVGNGLGFDVDDNALSVFWAGGETQLPQAPKSVLARQLLQLIAERYHAHHPAQDPR
jgi:phosphopantothenoylcysteine decarboxylase/phosphopantothenate--cysteine ligase